MICPSQWILLCLFCIINEHVFASSRGHSDNDRHSSRHRSVPRLWSEWSQWSSCSRTCGGGVKQRTRTCKTRPIVYSVNLDNCLGNATEYELCSIYPCPLHTGDFLDFQCSQRNGHHMGGRKIDEWISYRYGSNPCELQCRSKDRSFLSSFGKVIDGTSCPASDPRDRAICVNGRCTPVDCAGFLGTDNRRDRCGVCRGDNSTCVRYQNTFWGHPRHKVDEEGRKDRHYDYDEVFRIPAGATNILVSEKSDTNFLVLVDNKGSFLVNGNWRVQSPGRLHVQGIEFMYNRTWDGQERLSSAGPTRSALTVMVLGSGDVPTVHYEYWTSLMNTVAPFSFQDSHPILKSFDSPTKYHYDTLQSIGNNIESHIPSKSSPPTKYQGYKSYYHRNEILKSVPSWSIKRHPFPKQTSNKTFPNLSLASRIWKNDTNRDFPSRSPTVSNEKKRDKSDEITTAVSIVRNETKSTNVRVKSASDFGRPNGTSAFTRADNVPSNKKYKEHTKKRFQNRYDHETEIIPVGSKNHLLITSDTENKRTKRKRKSNHDSCPPCPKVKEQTKHFCSSDFVLRATVLHIEKQQLGNRIELDVIRSFKNRVPIVSREYIWTPDFCPCPRLRPGQEYILMGHSVVVPGRRESRLTVNRQSFVRKYSQKRARTMLKLVRDQNSVCKKFQKS